ncbi:MAG: GGDEF domain-containing protein [Lachnospiraceae bacterium]|nr:GGDEF domain-containing protein [Lachnospiraceae bacterium]
MDYSAMIDNVHGIACIVSLRRAEDGNDTITITAANRNYLASVNKQDEEFIPNRPYTYYIYPDPNFEVLTRNCINEHKIEHQYVNAARYGAWLDFYMIPLEDDADGNGYSLFSYEMSPMSDSEKLIDISAATAYMVLKTCIKLRENDDFISNFDSVVKDIRSQCESEGCSIILINNEENRIDTIFYDNTDNFAPDKNDVFLKPEFYDIVINWEKIMEGTNCFIITNDEELNAVKLKDPAWYESLIISRIKSLVLYPLRTNNILYGYILASNFNSDKTSFIREIMELNSFILSAEVENYRMRKKLEMIGITDMLTGVLNRNAMSKKIDELISDEHSGKKGIGIVFIDVNGLKTVNDLIGHNEGDEILKNVASKIRSVYTGNNIYRAGGDEFLVIIDDMDKDRFSSLFDKLRSLSRVKGEPAFAIGAYYDDTGMDINRIMHIADKNMYRDKADYYETNPDADRRTSF